MGQASSQRRYTAEFKRDAVALLNSSERSIAAALSVRLVVARELHPVNRSGETEHRLFILGALTEGTRYFTHYLPSPHSRIRAILDAQACVDQVMG